MFDRVKAASFQEFERRSDLTNGLLMAVQGIIGLSLGLAINHIGLEPKVAIILSVLVIASKLVAWRGWVLEARQMDGCYRRDGFLTWLARAQGAVGFGLGILVMHVGLAATAALGFAFVVIIAKTLAWIGWRRQALHGNLLTA